MTDIIRFLIRLPFILITLPFVLVLVALRWAFDPEIAVELLWRWFEYFVAGE